MIFAVDVGTTLLKAGLVNRDGQLVKVLRRELNVIDGCMADTDMWLASLASVCREFGAESQNPDCIIISGNGPTMAPSNGGRAFLWMHREAVAESAEIQKKTGIELDPSFFLPKALFIKNRFPELYRGTDFFLSTPEFVSYRLTGNARTMMPLEGLEKWYWTDSLLDELGLDSSKFPPFISPGAPLGRVTSEASGIFGFREGTPVLSGCPDFVGAIIGSGAMHAGQVCDRSGTSEGINLCSVSPSTDPHLMCYRHPNGTDWNVSGIISTSGRALQWARSVFLSEDISYEGMYDFIEKNSVPGSRGVVFHPYLSGERAPLWDPLLRADFSGMGLETGKADLLRSVCEGVCFSIRHVLDFFQGIFGSGSVKEIRLAGGSSVSGFMDQLRADITGVEVKALDCEETGLQGLGILALSSLYGTALTQTADRAVKIRQTYTPDPEKAAVYDSLFRRYRETAGINA